MSSYAVQDIIDQVETQIQSIDGSPNYNYSLNHNYIYKQFKTMDEVSGYPAVCISSIKAGESIQTDQTTYEIPFSMDVFAYAKKSSDYTNPFDAIIALCQDVEKAIYANERLGDNEVFNLRLIFDMATLDDYGVALISLAATAVYEKTG